MFPITSEYHRHLEGHNIRVSQLDSPEMSDNTQPRKVVHLPKVRMLSRGRASSIKITNVKSIKPPDSKNAESKSTAKTSEVDSQSEEVKLRAQLQKEIAWRSRGCTHARYSCALPVCGGGSLCARHSGAARTCEHRTAAGDACTTPAADADGRLCYEHAFQLTASRLRSAAPPPPVVTSETLLHRLQHYVRPERTRTTSCASSVSVVSDPADLDLPSPHAVDPFKQIDAVAVNAAYSASILEHASGSESDADVVTVAREDHDDEIDSVVEGGPLWCAGVFTAEEAVSEARGALTALREAYLRQMSRLHCLLAAARQHYVRSLKHEKEQYCSIFSQSRSGPQTVRERRALRKLKAYVGYHARRQHHAVLARKLHHKRARKDAGSSKSVGRGSRCVYTEYSARCPAPALPAARHCLHHIPHDPHQVLFTWCGDSRGAAGGSGGSGGCRVVEARVPGAACRYHADPPHHTVFTLNKDGSASESESSSCASESHTESATEALEALAAEPCEPPAEPYRP